MKTAQIPLCFMLLIMFCSCAVKNVKTTVATIVCPLKEFPYKFSVIEYSVNNKKYFSKAPLIKHMTKGDKFIMVYDSLNPLKQEVCIEYPVILPDEETLLTQGKIVKCVTGEYSKITYEYNMDGVKYQKLQIIKGFWKLKKKSECTIRVVKANPGRAKLENY